MSRPRPLLPWLALALLLAAAVPALAAPAVTTPMPALDLAGASCPAATPAAAPALDKLFKAIIPPDFILCTCKTCTRHPDVICQVSPSGFSILCSDWAAQHCPSTTDS